MKHLSIVTQDERPLSNYELMQLCTERDPDSKHSKVLERFEEYASEMAPQLSSVSIEDFKKCRNELLKAGLSGFETMQMMNMLPVRLVEVYVIVRDCAGRYTEGQVEEMIQIIRKYMKIENS